MSVRPGTLSLIASLTGTIALAGDVANLLAALGASQDDLSTVLEPLFSVANLIGFVLGLASRRGSDAARAGLHLSWSPFVAAFVLLACYRPELAAELVRRLATLLLNIANGLADTIALLAG